MNLRILLADDHTIVREGLRSLLERQDDMEIVGEADNGRDTVRLTRELLPDVVIMDVQMPGLNGIEATRQIISEISQVRVIALSMHLDRRYICGILSAGASGYLLKECAFEDLVRAVRAAYDGEVYLGTGIASIVVKDYLRHLSSSDLSSLAILSHREQEVLQLLAEGKSTREIAVVLNVSTKTVETHRRQIMDKANVNSIAGLTKLAIREGLTSLEHEG